jgi:hypothetical protein
VLGDLIAVLSPATEERHIEACLIERETDVAKTRDEDVIHAADATARGSVTPLG